MICIVYNTRENEDQKCFFRDSSIRTLLKIKDKQGAKALVKNIILEESLEVFYKVLNQMTVGGKENFFGALLKKLGLKEREEVEILSMTKESSYTRFAP